MSGRELKCCFDQAKQKFNRSFTAASEEVFLEFVLHKMCPNSSFCG